MELSLRDKTNMNEGQTPLEIKKNGRHPLKKKNGRKMFGRGKSESTLIFEKGSATI